MKHVAEGRGGTAQGTKLYYSFEHERCKTILRLYFATNLALFHGGVIYRPSAQ